MFFTEKINKIALSSNDDKRMQLTDSIETYAYGMTKDLIFKKEKIKCNNIIKQYKNVYTYIFIRKRSIRSKISIIN